MLTFDLRDFERTAAALEGASRQIPFALAQSLNDAVSTARSELIEQTWPSHVQQRNKAFLGAALRREFARKNSLRAAVVESGPAAGKGNLSLHGAGGARRPRQGALAIPNAGLKSRRTGKGVPKSLRPRALPNSFRKGDVIYQRTGKYRKGDDGRGLKLMYVLKPSAAMRADVPFATDFDRTVVREIWRRFTPRLQAALLPRRK